MEMGAGSADNVPPSWTIYLLEDPHAHLRLKGSQVGMHGGQVGFRLAPSEGDQRKGPLRSAKVVCMQGQIKAGKAVPGRYRISVEWRLLKGDHCRAAAFISIQCTRKW